MTSPLYRFVRDAFLVSLLVLCLTEVWFLIHDRFFSELFTSPTALAYQGQYETPEGLRVSYLTGPLRLQLNPVTGFNLIPNTKGENFSINDQGFRGKLLNMNAAANLRRIVLIGGSTAFGYGATSDAHTIDAFLAKNLTAVEVMNAGVISYETGNEYQLTRSRLLEYSPDLLLAVHGWNDFHAFLRMKNKRTDEFIAGFPHTMNQVSHLRNITQDNPFLRIPHGLLTVLFPRSERAVRHTYTSFITTSKTIENLKEIDLLVDRFLDSIIRMKRLAEQEGFQFVSFLQPDLNAIAYSKKLDFSQNFVREYGKGYHDFCRLVLKRAAEQGLPVYDLGQFSDSFQIHHFVDSVHFNDSGSELAAEIIASVLLREGFITPAELQRIDN